MICWSQNSMVTFNSDHFKMDNYCCQTFLKKTLMLHQLEMCPLEHAWPAIQRSFKCDNN